MDKLHFDLITDKRIKRVVEMLDILSLENFPMTFEMLASWLNVSVQTIITDIEYLETILPKEVKLKIMRKVGVFLEIEKGFNIIPYIDSLSQSSLLYELIVRIFRGENYYFLEWVAKLYTSEMSLKRYLKDLKEKLIEFNLSLSLNPLTIIGKEVDIRYFYYTYFSTESYSTNRPRPSSKHIQFYDNCLKLAEEKMHTVFNVDFKDTIFWIMIIQQRLETGNMVEIERKVTNTDNGSQFFYYFDQFYSESIKDIFLIDQISKDESIFAYLICLNNLIDKEMAFNKVRNKQKEEVIKIVKKSRVLSNIAKRIKYFKSR